MKLSHKSVEATTISQTQKKTQNQNSFRFFGKKQNSSFSFSFGFFWEYLRRNNWIAAHYRKQEAWKVGKKKNERIPKPHNHKKPFCLKWEREQSSRESHKKCHFTIIKKLSTSGWVVNRDFLSETLPNIEKKVIRRRREGWERKRERGAENGMKQMRKNMKLR